MNILMIGGLVPWHPAAGGGQILAYKLAEALAGAGHQIDYVALAPRRLQRPVEWGKVIYTSEETGKLSTIEGILRDAREGEGKKYDVIHVHSANDTLRFYLGYYLRHVIYRHIPHMPQLVLGMYMPQAYAIPRSFEEASWMLLCRQADLIFTVSDFSRHNIARAYRISLAKIVVMYAGVDAPFLRPRQTGQGKSSKLIFCGRLSGRLEGRRQQKGLDILLRAMPQIIDRFRVELEIVGTGPLLKPFRARVGTLGLEDHVKFSGFVEHEKMPDRYAKADLLVLPSRRESFGIVLAEAMAAGLPVVATRVGAIPEVVVDGETGILVPPEDPRTLAMAINDLLDHPRRMESMGAKGKKRVERLFTWDKAAERVVRGYKNILRRHAGLHHDAKQS